MNKTIRCAFIILLFSGLPEPSSAQSDVRRATELGHLYLRIKKISADNRHQALADTCRLFFVVLGDKPFVYNSGGGPSVQQVYEEYTANPFIGQYALEVFGLWIRAGKKLALRAAIRNHKAETDAASRSQKISNDTATAMQSSLAVLRYQKALAQLRHEGQQVLEKTNLVNLNALAAHFGLRKEATTTSHVQLVALLLQHYEQALMDTPNLQSQGVEWINQIVTAHGTGEPNIATELIQLRNALPEQLASYQAAKAKIKDEVINELRAYGPGRATATTSLYAYLGTGRGPDLAATLGPHTTTTAGPTASWETAVLDGTARFVAKRLREEVSAAFVQQFATLLSAQQKTTYGNNLQLLFPATKELLTSGSSAYVGTLVQPLRAAMQQDLRKMLFRYGEVLLEQATRPEELLPKLNSRILRLQTAIMPPGGTVKPSRRELTKLNNQLQAAQDSLRENPKIVEVYERTATMRRYAYLTTLCLHHLAEGRHPAEVFDTLGPQLQRPDNWLFKQDASYVKGTLVPTLTALNQLSKSFADTRSLRRGWVEENQLTALLQQPQALVLFQGLVLQRLLANPPENLKYLLWQTQQGRGFEPFQQVVFGFAGLATRFEQQVQQLNRSASDSLGRAGRAQAVIGLYQTTLEMLRFAAVHLRPASPSGTQYALPDSVRAVGELAVQGYAAAQQQQYGLALTNLVQVLEKTLPAYVVEDRLNLPQVVRYGSVMAAVAQASTPNQVQSALEAGALPSGSARVKRESLFTASLNAYAGLTGGIETLPGSGLGRQGNLGFMAAIGPCLSWGLHRSPQSAQGRALKRYARARRAPWQDPVRREMRGSSLGLFLSVIDLGAPVLLHLGGNNSLDGTLPPDVDFRHVFAPGAFVTWNLRNSPLTLLAGGQFTGNLRRPTPTASDPNPGRLNSMRYNVSVAFDIPLVHFGVRTEARPVRP